MTHTVNGFGTTYTRAEQRTVAPGRCNACGRFSLLESYDTHLAVALLFIPTVRLKPLRVLAQCKACGNHHRMDHAAWVAAKDAARADITRARTTGSPQGVATAFTTFAGIATAAEVTAVIDDVRGAVGDDAIGLAHVGAGLLAVGDLDGAKEALERSLAASPSAEVEFQLGFVELCRDVPLAAHARLEGVWRNRVGDSVHLALLLIDCLLAHGESTLAARVAERLAAAFPELSSHRELQDLTRIAKAQPQGRRVFRPRHAALVPPPKGAPRVDLAPRKDTRVRDRLILGGLAASVLLLYPLVGLAAMRAGPVQLVSGATVAYDVDIDGETVHLPPGAVLKRTIGFRPHQMVVHAPTGPRTVDLDFGASLVTAPFHLLRTRVINPDGLAVVVREEIEYSTRFLRDNNADGRHSYDVLTGTVIDTHARFVFQPFPETISMKGSSQMVSRVAVDESGPFQGTAVLRGKRGEDAARAHLLARLAFYPGDVAALDALLDGEARKAAAKDNEKGNESEKADDNDDDDDEGGFAPDVIAAVDAVLATRPVDVEGWLRAADAGLVSQDDFDALVATVDGGGDACAVYLAILLGADATASRREAAAGCINEQLEAGIRAAVGGDVDRARAVLAAVPTSPLTPHRLTRWSLLAQLLRERARLEERLRSSLDPESCDAYALRLGLLVQQGALPAARLLLKEALDGVDDDGATAAHHDFIFAYNQGDVDAVVAILPKLSNARDFDFERILVTGAFGEEYEHIETHDIADQLVFWAAVLARHPNHAVARRKMATLFGGLAQPTWMQAAPPVSGLGAIGTNWTVRRATAVALAVVHNNDAMLDEAWRLCRPTSSPSLFVHQLRAARAPTPH